jgi:excisionase family DNA binding protein
MKNEIQTDLLTLKQASELFSISVVTLRRWIDAKHITSYKPSSKLLFVDKDNIEQFIKSTKK